MWKFAGITTQEKRCPTWKKQQWPWMYITRMKICTVQKVNAITDLEIMKKLKRMPRRHSMSIRIVLKGLSAKQKPCIIWVHLNIPSNFGGGKKEILIPKLCWLFKMCNFKLNYLRLTSFYSIDQLFRGQIECFNTLNSLKFNLNHHHLKALGLLNYVSIIRVVTF